MAISNVDTVTTGTVFVPEIWSELVLKFREKYLGAAKFFERRDMEVMNYGDIIHFPQVTEFTATSYTEGNKLEDSLAVNTEDDVDLTVDQYKVRPFLVSDKLSKQSKYDKKAINFKAAGYSVAKAIDSAILADSANYTNDAINAAGTAITNIDLTEAQTVLDELDVPEDERMWFFHPRVLKDLMDLSGNYFTSLDFSEVKALVKGQINKMLLGSPVTKTTNVPTGTTGSPSATYYKNVYAHKQATGVAMQIKPETQEEYSVNFQGTLCNARALYGIKTLRANHGVIVNR